MNKKLMRSITGVILMIAASMAQAVPMFGDVLNRVALGGSYYFDAPNGNGFYRTDRFTNASSGYSVKLDNVQFLYLDPSQVGYSDLGTSNYLSVYAAAGASYPTFDLWGANWWSNDDPATVVWQNSLSTQNLGGIVLNPGEHIDIYQVARNNVTTAVGDTDEIGELVVGFKFTGEISPVPEPTTLALMGLGLAGIGFFRKRKQAA